MDDLHQEASDPGSPARRRFLTLAIGVLAALNALVMGIPFVNTLMGAVRKKKAEWSRVAEIGALPEDQPVEVKFQVLTEDAYHNEKTLFSVWVTRHADNEMTIFSPICPHLGCHYIWNPKAERFACPCHASMFAPDGKVLYGPAPRPLDTLPYKVESGVLFVMYEKFRVGTSGKIPL